MKTIQSVSAQFDLSVTPYKGKYCLGSKKLGYGYYLKDNEGILKATIKRLYHSGEYKWLVDFTGERVRLKFLKRITELNKIMLLNLK